MTAATPEPFSRAPTGDQDPKPEPFEERAPIQYNSNIPLQRSKKKGGKKSIASRGPTALPKNRGNGFEGNHLALPEPSDSLDTDSCEEYFADPPMTPDEAKEEKFEIYNPDLPFEERMQNCIQRFRSRRRVQGERTLFFNEYLFLGGVDTNPGAFGGLDKHDLKDLTPAERREATATDIIYGNLGGGDRFYNGDQDSWAVDFAGVAAGFFSVALPKLTSGAPVKLAQGIDVVDNFLRYVIHHDVCPEYSDDLNAALTVCEHARVEWPMIQALLEALPGQFNLAAGDLFVPDEVNNAWSFLMFKRPPVFDAKTIFYSAFAFWPETWIFDRLEKTTPVVTKEYAATLELIRLQRPERQLTNAMESLIVGDDPSAMGAIGKATFKPAVIEDEWESPCVPEPAKKETELFFDDHLLDLMKPGMKMACTLCELNVGITFVKKIDYIVPSFYTFLPQELMRHYKPPRDNDRPAPSVHNPDAEDKQFDNEAKDG
ncbi:hypothetical protein G7046_g769 [Stylonectria norvegica]|nr:hypothetical protein G7046_g769 [Stylonectria norvegica]